MSSLTSDNLGLLEDIGKTFIPPTYLVFQHADKLHVKKTGAGIISGFNDVGSLVNSLAEEGDVFWFAKPKTAYSIAEEIVPPDKMTLAGAGWGTEIRASASINSLIKTSQRKFVAIRDLVLNGENLATKVIDAAETSDFVSVNRIEHCWLKGASDTVLDMTFAGDFYVKDSLIEGTDSAGTLRSNIGVKATNNAAHNVFERCHFGLAFYGWLFNQAAIDWKGGAGELHVKGGTCAHVMKLKEGRFNINNVWMESGLAINNILAGVSGASPNPIIRLNNCFLYKYTNSLPNIDVVSGGQIDNLEIRNTKLQNDAGTYNVDGSILNLKADMVAVDKGIDFTNISRYDVSKMGDGKLWSWSNLRRAGVATILNGQTGATFAHGLAAAPAFVTLGAKHAEVADAFWSADATNITITVPAAVTANRDVSYFAAVV